MVTIPSLPPLPLTQLLRQAGVRPKKRLGQNFLHDPQALEKIVAAAEIAPADWVLEIGPGLGSLTRYLAILARQVVAVELDATFLPILEQVLAPWPNVRLVHGDILALSPAELIAVNDYLVVANIPYTITSALIRHLLEASPRPRRLVLTVQKEVAERICAAPGEMSMLALSVQLYGLPRLVAHIPAGAFYPAPKVDSAVLRIDLKDEGWGSGTENRDREKVTALFQLARAGFGQKRKTLRNALAHGLGVPSSLAETWLTAAGIHPERRAETLSLEEWRRLTEVWLSASAGGLAQRHR